MGNRIVEHRQASGEIVKTSEEIVYMIVRKCCTSGNCITCISEPGHKYGTSVRVVQFLTVLEQMAKRVTENWSSYGAVTVEATEEELAKVIPSSAEYVRTQLKEGRANRSMLTYKGG